MPHLPPSIRAFAVTQRGHGDADRPDGYRTRDFAADLAAITDGLRGRNRAACAGGPVMAQLTSLTVDESTWLTVSLALALLAVAGMLGRRRQIEAPRRRRVLAAMTLFAGVTIGTMAFGHLLAVTTKLALGTLEGPLLLFYAIGVALALPSWWLIVHTRQVLASDDHARATLILNGWLTLTLLVMGLHNLPLAAPSILNVGYHLHSRRLVGWAIVGLAVVVGVGLFAGSLVFLASGQSFEQFSGME